MTRNLNVGDLVYDDKNYTDAVIVEVLDDNKVLLINDNYDKWKVDINYVYSVNKELSNKYNILICDEHNEDIDYPYYIPIAQENAYEIELEHFSELYS